MAGFLAPTIPDIPAAPVAASSREVASPDPTVGNLFGGIADIINVIGRGTGTVATVTQQDRDDKTLSPVFQSFRNLLAQRDSGDLTPSQFETRKNVLVAEAITANPSLRERVVNGLSVLAGEPIGTVEQTIEGTLRDNRNLWLQTPIGAASAVLAVDPSTDDDGNLNRTLFELAVDKLYNKDLFERADAAQTTEEVRVAKETNEFNNIKQAKWIDPLLGNQSQKAADIIKAHISVFMKTPGTSSDAISAVASLAGIKATWMSNFTTDAASRGLLDEGSYTTGLTAIAKQFDDQIGYLQLIADSEAAQLTVSQNRQEKEMIEILNSGGLIANDATKQAFSLFVLENNLVDVTALALAMKNFTTKSETLSQTASEPGTTSVYTDAFTVEATNLSEDLQIQDVTIGVAYWKSGQLFSPKALKNEDQRLALVTNLGRALGVMNVTGNPVSESTFDRVYDPGFINLYRSITKFDDEIARTLENVVRTHLGTTLDKRREFAKINIRNRLGRDFPGVTMKFDGDKFVINYGTGRGTTVPQTTLFDSLDKNGLPRTSEGVAVLLDGTRQLNKNETRAALIVQGVGSDEIDYLNKIVGTINMFPEFSDTALPNLSLEESVTVHRVTSPKDIEALQKGDTWEFIDQDGTVHRGVI